MFSVVECRELCLFKSKGIFLIAKNKNNKQYSVFGKRVIKRIFEIHTSYCYLTEKIIQDPFTYSSFM